MSVRVIEDDNHFRTELNAAGIRLVVVDFTASWWVDTFKLPFIDTFNVNAMQQKFFNGLRFSNGKRCGPCQRIAPEFERLPTKYPRAIFLKVDVDKCQDTAASEGVSAMPTFIFYRNKSKIDRLQGADMAGLEAKVQQHIGSGGDDSAEDFGQGLVSVCIRCIRCIRSLAHSR